MVEHRLAKARVASSNLVIRSIFLYVSLAQLDRASGYGPEGRGFESSRIRQQKTCNFYYKLFFTLYLCRSAGIGRQACLRGMCEKSREGSSPSFCTRKTIFIRVKLYFTRNSLKSPFNTDISLYTLL